MSLDNFLDNARDLTVKHGLKAASLLFASGSAYLIARHGIDFDSSKILRHVAAPAMLFASNIAGFFNNEKLQNTLGVIGSALMSAGFAADEDPAYGQAALHFGGVLTGIPGSHLNPKNAEPPKTIAQDGMVQTAVIQGSGTLGLLGLAFIEGTTEMIAPYAIWAGGAALKSTRAVLNARRRLQPTD